MINVKHRFLLLLGGLTAIPLRSSICPRMIEVDFMTISYSYFFEVHLTAKGVESFDS